MISIIIPVYNQAAKLKQCLESIVAQTEQDFEIIVVNDGSKDNIGKVFAVFQGEHPDLNIMLLNQKNHGSNPARNRGFKEAKGEYVIFCDADLVLDKTMLAKMKQALISNPLSSFAYVSFQYGRKTFHLFPFTAERLKQMPFIHTTSLIRTKDFPGFDEKIRRLQDWDLWLTMLERGKSGIFIDEVLFRVRTGGHISTWLPKFAYKLLPFLPQVKRYKRAEKIIKDKHRL
ncbi:MAG: glycosyltransferase family A protein [Candidatus Falkowbacteria bacterium]